MALSYSNTLGTALNNAMTPSPLNSANAARLGLGTGLSISPTGQVHTAQQSLYSAPPAVAPKVPTTTPVVAKTSSTQSATGAVPTATTGTGLVGLPPPVAPVSNAVNNAAPATPVSNSPTYSGLVGNLAQNAQTTASQGQMTPEEQAARQQLAAIPGLIGSTDAEIESHPSDMAFQMGREAVAGRNIAAQQQSLADRVSAYAAERGANVTADTAAGSQITGAAGLAAPQLTTPGQAVFNPVEGSYSGASSGGGNPTTAPSGIDQGAWSQYVQDYASGNMGAIPGSITSNPNLSGQLQQAVQAANPGFNYNTAVGQGQAQQSNASTAGTAVTNTAASGYNASAQSYNTLYTANQAADSQAKQVQSILGSTGLNAGVPAYNQAINSLGAHLGSAKVTALTTAITELQNVYGQLLNSAGNTPSGSEAQALAVLNPNSSAQQITAAIGQLQQAAYNKLSAQYGQLNTYQSQLGGAQSAGGSTGGTVVQTKAGAVNTNW